MYYVRYGVSENFAPAQKKTYIKRCRVTAYPSLIAAVSSKCNIVHEKQTAPVTGTSNEPILSGHTVDAHTCASSESEDFSGKYNIRVRGACGEQRPRRRP